MTGWRANSTVLLVDDEQRGLELRRHVLENSGFRVLTATGGEQAMNLFRLHDIDVVVTGHLPGHLSTAACASAMKRSKPHVSIITLTSQTSVDEALPYADRFLGKSEGPDTLVTAIDRIMTQKSADHGTLPVAHPTRSDEIATLQSLLAAIVEDSSDAILSKTLDGTITSWNRAAESMYGYSRDEMIGQSVSILLPQDRPDEVAHILSRLRRGETIRHFETIRLTKNKTKLHVSLTISPIEDGQGRLVGASSIARDISEQRKMEEALQRSERLALAGRMAATVAHEINNPLEAISNVLYLLRTAMPLTSEAASYVEIAQEQLRRVSEIARLTLGAQRVDAARREPVHLQKLLEDVLTLFHRRITAAGIHVDRRYRYDGVIVGCAGELRQVFSNLIVNAIDALTETGDKLVLSLRRARRWDTREQGVRISVVDNGPGIPPEQRSQLFQAFYTTKGEQGTGIGLWVSSSIVKQHGGTLRMHSSTAPGRSGACFSVFLPLSNLAPETESASQWLLCT